METEPTLSVSRPEVVHQRDLVVASDTVTNFDVAGDGERFVTIVDESAETPGSDPLILVQHWVEELKRLVPLD